MESGSYDYTVTVTDSYGATASAGSNVIVNAEPNEAPTVVAGDDQSLQVAHDDDPNTTTVDTQVCAEGADSDDDVFTYAWNTGATTDCIDLTLEAGSYDYTVTVTDSYGVTDSDDMNVSVAPETNTAPVADAGENLVVFPEHDGDPLTNTVEITLCPDASFDPDGDELTYEWVGYPPQRTNCLTEVLSSIL